MILSHPAYPKKKILRRSSYLLIQSLQSEGWTDVTPERTFKQKEVTARWKVHGHLARTLANLRAAFRANKMQLSKEQMRILNNAEVVIQQLIKKTDSSQRVEKIPLDSP